MSTIPASQLVNVTPGVLSAAGTQNTLNGLFLTNNTAVPIGLAQSFPSAASVGAFFGLSSPEYLNAAVPYFTAPATATKTPATLYFAQYPSAAVGGYLRSASLAALTLTQLQALSGTLTITFAGVALTSANIVLTTASSFTAAAALIEAAFTSPPFSTVWDTQRSAFVFTSTATGAVETITYATGTLAAGLSLTQATGAVLSQGAAAATPSAFMTSLVNYANNFNGFSTIFEPVTADKTAFSTWTGGQGDQYLYVGYDSDPNAAVQGNTTSWGYNLTLTKPDGTVPIYGTLQHAAFALGWLASLDYTRKNGRSTLAYRSQGGLVAQVTDGVTSANLLANGYNFYGIYGAGNTNSILFYPGSASGKYAFADSFANQILIRNNLQLALLSLLTSVNTIPYNQAGYAQVHAACNAPIDAAINFGAIVKGVTLSAAEVSELITAAGLDISSPLFASGYYLQVLDATTSTRATRSSPPITLWYTDGQSIQSISLAAIEVV